MIQRRTYEFHNLVAKKLHDWFDPFITGVLDDSWLDVVNQLKEQNDMNKNLEVIREKDIVNVY